ncbi:MAG: nitrous oxide reductase family maturation protein NosD [Bryobacteraceae bacterium]
MMRAAFIAAGLAVAVHARVLEVGQESRSIQAAVDAAAPGDVLRIAAGRYEGNLVLHKPVALEGAGGPIIRGTGAGSVVTITAPGCVVKGLVIERSGGMLMDEDSGILLKSGGNAIVDNELRDVLFGVYLLRSSGNTVRGNRITGRRHLELGERGAGIHVYDSEDNVFDGNRVADMRDGLYLQNANRSRIARNHVSRVRYGLHYMYSNSNEFDENVFERNVAGAAIMYSRNIRLRRNSFIHNRGFSSFGILFQDSDDLVVEQNVIADNGVGLFLETLRSSEFRENLVAANDIAIEIFASCSRNRFTRNNFTGNLSPIWLVGKRTDTAWNTEQAGNYWSEYDGYDLDADGIGDVPYRIQNFFEHLEGNYPRLRLYFFSPASQALAFAERAFPVLEGSKEIDRRPLVRPASLPVRMPDEGTDGGVAGLAIPISMVACGVLLLAKGRFS